MFLDNLSTSVLQICSSRCLSYEAAAEQCNLSSRYFGDIARGKTAPSILTLEKLCIGFSITPNDLLIPSGVPESSAQMAMPVTQVLCVRHAYGLSGFPICPNCGISMEREYQAFCDRCGQRLDWRGFSKAEVVMPHK